MGSEQLPRKSHVERRKRSASLDHSGDRLLHHAFNQALVALTKQEYLILLILSGIA